MQSGINTQSQGGGPTRVCDLCWVTSVGTRGFLLRRDKVVSRVHAVHTTWVPALCSKPSHTLFTCISRYIHPQNLPAREVSHKTFSRELCLPWPASLSLSGWSFVTYSSPHSLPSLGCLHRPGVWWPLDWISAEREGLRFSSASGFVGVTPEKQHLL